jgi:membrane protein YqaA with SNARE-associated domain
MSIVEQIKRNRWLLATIYAVVILGLSVGLYFLLRYLMAYFGLSVEGLATTAYLVVFVTTLVSNASIIIPVPVFVAVMITAASKWDPILVALIASSAGTLGEITGYYAGYWGKRFILTESAPGYERLVGWMKRYGPWGIFFVSLQPILPFDVAGLLAGASKLPLWKFLLPCWAGKFPKYLLACYLGPAVLNILPFPPL